MKSKIFLTGASGFIGKNILENLAQKYHFFSPTHKQLNLLDTKAVDKYFKNNGPFDFVLHAAITGGNRMTGDGENYAIDSMRMFFNLSKNKAFFKKFFYFGSGIEYSKDRPIKNIAESEFGKIIPSNNWGLFKYICANYAQDNNFLNLRIFGMFGKYEDWRVRFVSNAILKNIHNLPIVINKNVKIDYLFADDFVKILEGFLTRKAKFQAYNITPGLGVDLISIAKIINVISTQPVPIKINHHGLDNEYTGSNKRLLSEFGNVSFTQIDDAIRELYAWYLKNKIKIRRAELAREYF